MTVKDLSNQVPGLSISSMQGGNTVSDDPALAMTAPGSVSVLPVPDRMDILPQPQATDQPRTVLMDPDGTKGHVAPVTSPDSGTLRQPSGRWTYT